MPRSLFLQRVFSTFPDRLPGLGLLILRIALSATAVLQAVLLLSQPSALGLGPWLLVAALFAAGLCVFLGVGTPFASSVLILAGLWILFTQPPLSVASPFSSSWCLCTWMLSVAGIMLLGPGAFSLDAIFFGRREIVIPPSGRSPRA